MERYLMTKDTTQARLEIIDGLAVIRSYNRSLQNDIDAQFANTSMAMMLLTQHIEDKALELISLMESE